MIIINKNKLVVIIIFFVKLFSSYEVIAVKAYPNIIKYRLSDGGMADIQLKGDENFKWAVSQDGYTLLYNTKGKLVYAKKDNLNQVVPSPWEPASKEKRSQALVSFLETVPKKLAPSISSETLKSIRSKQKARTRSLETSVNGSKRILVILMEFQDVHFINSRADFDGLFNQIGYTKDGARGSVRDFYTENSMGQLDLTCDIVGPYTAQNNMSYYGGNTGKNGDDRNPEELFMEAIQEASKDIEFSDYDLNNDGYVDNVHIIFAGYGEEAGASPSAIWSHEVTFPSDIEWQGMKFRSYSCAPELRENSGNGISRIGVHCHEIGHAFGAMDYYDTDGTSGGEYEGTGQWDIMASGSWNDDGVLPAHFNPYIRVYSFGWSEAKIPEGEITLSPLTQQGNKIYQLNTPTSGEFFLLEDRQQVGFDQALPGHGLMIYHIHSLLENEIEMNAINTTSPQLCYPVCASSSMILPTTSPSSYGEINSDGCPFPGASGKHSFTDQTTPSARSWDGGYSNIILTDIEETAEGKIRLNCAQDSVSTSNLVFFDDFESGKFSNYWRVAQIKGNPWQINPPADDEVGTKPKLIDGFSPQPINGQCYMFLVASNLAIENTIATASLQGIELNETQLYELSFKYQIIPVLKQSDQNKLKIKHEDAYAGENVLLATISDVRNEWTSFRINLPLMSQNDKIIFEGNAIAGGIYLDDIKISNRNVIISDEPNPIRLNFLPTYWNYPGGIVIRSEKVQLLAIYTLDGRLFRKRMIQTGDNEIPLPYGFYIISASNTRFKVFVQ